MAFYLAQLNRNMKQCLPDATQSIAKFAKIRTQVSNGNQIFLQMANRMNLLP